jgi:hypothetical protein
MTARERVEMTDLELRARKIANELVVLGGSEREAYILAALSDAERAGVERAAKIVERWHIKRGGYTAMAREIRESTQHDRRPRAMASKRVDRKTVLLRACYDMLKQQQESHTVLSPFEMTVFYDDADCDGYCLIEDIELELGIEP